MSYGHRSAPIRDEFETEETHSSVGTVSPFIVMEIREE
jgi:hypothetical protein